MYIALGYILKIYYIHHVHVFVIYLRSTWLSCIVHESHVLYSCVVITMPCAIYILVNISQYFLKGFLIQYFGFTYYSILKLKMLQLEIIKCDAC